MTAWFDPGRQQVADRTVADQVPGGSMERAASQVVVDGQDHAVPASRADHGLGVGDAEGHRLLDQDVLAGIGGGDRLPDVLVVAGGDVDRVDVAGQHLIEASGLALDPAVGPVPEPARLVVVEPSDSDPAGLEGRQHPGHGHVAGPEQTEGDPIHHLTDPAVSPPMK